MKIRVDDRKRSPTERIVLFETVESLYIEGARRYCHVAVYVYTYVGEYPHVIIRSGDDDYSAGAVRTRVRLMLAAADWIEQHVQHRKVRASR